VPCLTSFFLLAHDKEVMKRNEKMKRMDTGTVRLLIALVLSIVLTAIFMWMASRGGAL